MEYRVLGKLEVSRGDRSLDLGPYRQRSLLALMLTAPNSVFSTDQLIDGLWGDDRSADRQNSLWVYVSGLRKALEPDREKRSDGTILLTRAPGYLVEADPMSIDAVRFEHMVGEGRLLAASDPSAASIVLGEALSLWRGRAFEEFMYESWAQQEIARLDELRLGAVEARLDADLARGLSGELISELETLVREHPLREGLTSQLMLALHRSGRQAEALRSYQHLSARLGDELGIEPSSRLKNLEAQIVTGDPAIELTESIQLDVPEPGLGVRGYELREKIGVGAVGDAYRAFQPAVGREVVVTVIRPEIANDPDYIRRFEAEAQTVASLESPHIVPLYDYWREPDAAYLITRLMPGGTLASVLEHRALTPDEVQRLVGQVGDALAAAHRAKVVHREVSTDTILVDDDGNAYLYGLGRIPATDHETEGAFHDVTSLAAVATQALTGLDGDVEQIRGALTADSRRVIDRAMSTDGEGYADIHAFVRDLQRALMAAEEIDETLVAELDNPFKGLRAFGATDVHDFHGRERLVERLVNRLGHITALGRFIAIVGPSGSGKSSVARAGLLPALRRGAAPMSENWFTVEMTPAPHPFEALEDALLSIAVDPPTSMLEILLGENGIHRTLDRILPADGSQLVLLIDQFEELFTQVEPAAAEQFLEALVSAVRADRSRLRVVVTLRADFYDRPLRHRGLGELLREGTEVITPMSPEELERAITGPVEGSDVRFEPSLVAELVHEVIDRAGALPLLQYTLTELFDARSGSIITHESYRTLGGVSGALVSRADGLLSQLGAEATELARQAFLRLITIGEGTNDTRRRVLRRELEQLPGDRRVLEGVLDTFGRHRLLSFDRDPVTRGPTVEISHEALLSEWDQLRQWIEASRHDVRNQRRLAQAMDEWQASGSSTEYLLRGGRLDQLHGWASITSLPLLTPEREFLDASVAERDRVDDADRAREQRALDAEDAAQQRSRQLRVAGVTGVFVAVLAVFGIWQWRSADSARDVAEIERSAADDARVTAEAARDEATRARNDRDSLVTAKEYISAAEAAFVDDPDLSLLYGVEAIRATADLDFATEEAVDSVHWALQRLGVHFELGFDPETAVRWGPYGLTGVFFIPPSDLIRLAESSTERRLTESDCVAVTNEPCPKAADVPPNLPLQFGEENYRASLRTIQSLLDADVLRGTTVTIATDSVFEGLESLGGLESQMRSFTAATGISVDFVDERTVELFLGLDNESTSSRTDISIVDRPEIPEWASERAVDLSNFLDGERFRSDFGGYLTELMMVEGEDGSELQMVPFNIRPKGLVYYAKPAFEAGGYELPATFDELVSLSEEIRDAGQTPWCFHWESALDTGWPGNDVLEALVARAHGIDVYDRWVAGDLGFSSSEVLEAAELAEQLFFSPGFVNGGTDTVTENGWEFALLELLDVHPDTGEAGPGCMFTIQGAAAKNFLGGDGQYQQGGVLGEDIGVFMLPPVDAAAAPVVTGAGSVAFATSDRPEVRALLKFISSPVWGEVWAGNEADGTDAFISSNQEFRSRFYDRVTRSVIHPAHITALGDGTWRFDADGLMPDGFAGSIGRPGPLLQAMSDWINQVKPVEELFADLDLERPKYE